MTFVMNWIAHGPQVQTGPTLSSGELEIVSLLWEHGPLTVAEAHETFSRTVRPVGLPTMQTVLNRLAEKGYLRRTDRRPAQYEAAITSE